MVAANSDYVNFVADDGGWGYNPRPVKRPIVWAPQPLKLPVQLDPRLGKSICSMRLEFYSLQGLKQSVRGF